MKECSEEVLWGSVVGKCCEAVLCRRGVVKECREGMLWRSVGVLLCSKE